MSPKAAALATPHAVLFDLDGTLVDTAPDLGAAANHVRAELGLPPLPLEHYRPFASGGARALLRIAVDVTPDDPPFAAQRESFLAYYRANLSRHSQLFPRMADVLAHFERHRLPWGVVTNKPAWLAEPLMQELRLAARAACLVGAGDALAPKPAPDLLLEACRRLKRKPADCVYVGDDRRDIDAARAAGMPFIAAAWGYLGENESPEDWHADAVIAEPAGLLRLLS